MVAGAFEIEGEGEMFNLKHKDVAGGIPDDQRKISHDVYEARNILKLLKDKGAFRNDVESFNEFITRVLQAAKSGCVEQHVDTRLAAEALEQIRTDIVRRKGRAITYRYLFFLALWALAGAGVAVVIILAGAWLLTGLAGYGWVIMGSMGGAWISVAAARREVSFEGIQDFLDLRYEPFIRMVFVGSLSAVLALFLQLEILTLKIGEIDFSTFPTNVGLALALGLIAGIGEKALSVQVIERARKVLAPAAAAS